MSLGTFFFNSTCPLGHWSLDAEALLRGLAPSGSLSKVHATCLACTIKEAYRGGVSLSSHFLQRTALSK